MDTVLVRFMFVLTFEENSALVTWQLESVTPCSGQSPGVFRVPTCSEHVPIEHGRVMVSFGRTGLTVSQYGVAFHGELRTNFQEFVDRLNICFLKLLNRCVPNVFWPASVPGGLS